MMSICRCRPGGGGPGIMAFPGEHLGEQSDSATCVSFQPQSAGGISSASTSKIPPHPHRRNSPHRIKWKIVALNS